MPQSYDGDIRLSATVSMNTENVKREARNLKKSMDEILSSQDTKGNPKLEKLAQQIQKSYLATERLQKKLNEATSAKVPTKEYTDLQKEIERTDKKIQDLITRQEKMQDLGETGTKGWDRLQWDLEDLSQKFQTLKRQKEELEASGQAFKIGDSTQVDKITEQLSFATQNGQQLVGKFEQVAQEASEAAAGSSKLGAALKAAGMAAMVFGRVAKAAFNGVKAGIRAFRSGIEKVRSGFSKLKNAASKAFGHINNSSKHGLKTLIKYGLGVRGLFALFRKLRGYASDAFQTLAGQSASFNRTMSNITNTFGQFKNSIATALQPIITIVEPILIRIMNLFINAANAVGTFFATLTGQKYIYRAVKANNSYADSVSNTGKAAKEANKQLAEYDKLMVIQSQDAADSAGGGSGGGGGFTEELIDPTNSVSKFAQDLKDAWENEDFAAIGEIVAGKINEVVSKIDEAIKWENVGPKITKWVNNIGTAFNSLMDNIDWALIGQTIGDGLNTITYTIETFLDSFNIDEVGTKLSELVNSLNDTVDWEAVGRTVSKGLNEITGAVNNFAYNTDWNSIGNNIGQALTTMVEGVDAEELGKALAAPAESINQTLNGLLENFEENGTWATAGTKIGQTINSWFSSIDWETMGENITLGVDGIVTSIGALFDETNWKDIGADLAEVLNGVVNIDWKNVGKTIGDATGDILELFTSLFEKVDWQQLGRDIVDLVLGVDWITLFKQTAKTISSIIAAAADVAIGIIEEFNFWEVIKALVGSILSFLANIEWSNYIGKIVEFVGALVGNIVSSIVNFGIDLSEFVVNVIHSIKDWFTKKKSEWDEAGLSIWEGLWEGIKTAASNIWNWIKEYIFNPFIEGFKNAFGIHSPSTVMAEMGGYLIDGLKEGLSNIWESIKEKFTNMLQSIKDWFTDKKNDLIEAWDAFKEGIGDITAKLFGVVDSTFNTLKEAWDGVKEKVKELWAKAKGDIEEKFTQAKEGWNNLKEGGKELLAKAKGDIEQKFTEAKESWNNLVAGAKELWAKAKGITEQAFTDAKNAWSGIVEGTKELWAKAKGVTEDAFTAAKSAWEGLTAGAKELWAKARGTTEEAFTSAKTAWEGLKEGAKDLWAKLKGDTAPEFTSAKSSWEGIKTETKTLTANLVASLGTAASTVKGWWDRILNWFRGGSDDKQVKSDRKFSLGATLASGVGKTIQGWWSTFVNWFRGGNSKKTVDADRKFSIGAKSTTSKTDVGNWWTQFKNWWGTKQLGVEGKLKITAAEMGKGVTVRGNAVVDLNAGGGGGHYTREATGAIISSPTKVIVGEAGPEAIIPLKRHTEWLDTVSKYVVAHMSAGKINIPKLAQGMVIPPNKQFLAMLGDQKSGTNVETPLKTIEQALENVISRARGGSQTIVLQLNGKQIAQAVWDENDKRYKQTGKAFAY